MKNNTQQLGYMEDKPNKDLVYVRPRGLEFTYYLSDCVQDSHEYHELLQTLDNASEGDHIRIIINNVGGEVGTCVQVIDHIRNCSGTVMGCMSGNAFSAAGLIWLACHGQEVSEHAMLMIHGAVGATGGKYVDMEKYIKAANKRTRLLYEDIFQHFLTKEEIDAVLAGDEMWLLFDDIVERLERRQEIFKQEHEAKQKAAYDEMFEEFGEELPDDILMKLTKQELISYMKGDLIVTVGEDGKIKKEKVENVEDND